MDPPDQRDEALAAAYQHGSSKSAVGSGNKRAYCSKPTIEGFYLIGKDLQNRSGHKIGSELSEDRRFCFFFGCEAHIALILWQMLIKMCLLHNESQIVHLLWALFFMMVYPGEKMFHVLQQVDPRVPWTPQLSKRIFGH